MKSNTMNKLLVLFSMTLFTATSLAEQQEKVKPKIAESQLTQMTQQQKNQDLAKQPSEIKNLPMILDSKNLQIEKFNKVRIENLDLDKMYGPGSGGGGNICAFNITAGAAFIAKHIDAVPFQNSQQRKAFLSKMTSVVFKSGANLSVRGQSVDAINYPSYGVIVLNERLCDQLADESITGYATLLHEYLGVAGIDDRTYQISGNFASKVKAFASTESTCRTDGCVFRKNSQNEAVRKWIASNDECETAVSWMQSLRRISNSRFELICGDTSDRTITILETKEIPDSAWPTFDVEILNSKKLGK